MYIPIPTNEEFKAKVEDYFERFPSIGSLWATAVWLLNHYRDANINVEEQYKNYIKFN